MRAKATPLRQQRSHSMQLILQLTDSYYGRQSMAFLINDIFKRDISDSCGERVKSFFIRDILNASGVGGGGDAQVSSAESGNFLTATDSVKSLQTADSCCLSTSVDRRQLHSVPPLYVPSSTNRHHPQHQHQQQQLHPVSMHRSAVQQSSTPFLMPTADGNIDTLIAVRSKTMCTPLISYT